MPTPSAERRERETAWFSLVLAWAAGYVNAVLLLQIAGVAVSHMTGNSVDLGVRIFQGEWAEAALLLTPIPLFVLGVMLGVVVLHAAEHSGARSPLAVVLGGEALLLAIYIAYAATQTRGTPIATHAGWQLTLLIALPTLAMAVQTALVQKVAGRRIRTTYITGMLSDFAEDVVQLGTWLRARTMGRSWRRRRLVLCVLPRQALWRRTVVLAGVWSCFFLGALIGAYVEGRVRALALIAPLVALLVLAAVEIVDPTLSPQREQHGPS